MILHHEASTWTHGGEADRTCLENKRTVRYRGFESLCVRLAGHQHFHFLLMPLPYTSHEWLGVRLLLTTFAERIPPGSYSSLSCDLIGV